MHFESVARHEAGGLDELHITVLKEWIDCELALGRHERLVDALDGHVDLESVYPSSGATDERIDLGSVGRRRALAVLTAGDGAVWLTAGRDTTVWKIDASTGRVSGGVDIGHVPASAAFGAEGLWFATGDGALVRVDPALDRPLTTIPLGVYPGPLQVGAGAVWVTSNRP